MRRTLFRLLCLLVLTLSLSARGTSESSTPSHQVIEAIPQSQGSEPHTWMALVTEDGKKFRVHQEQQSLVRNLEMFFYVFTVQVLAYDGPEPVVKILEYKRAD